jgi:hypothetical protein
MLSLPVLLQLVAVPALLLFFPELRTSSSFQLRPEATGSHKTEVRPRQAATAQSSVVKKHAAQQHAVQPPAAASVIESLKERYGLAAAAAAAVLQQLKLGMAHHTRTVQDALPQPVRDLALKLQQKPIAAPEQVAAQQHSEHQRYFDELERTKLIAADVIESPDWSEVLQRDGVTVHKKYLDKDAYGSAFACVKATAVVDASPATLMQLLLDSTRVLEYNRYR